MDKSMEKIDIIKLLLFLLLFILITLFMVLFMIVPNVKEYRLAKTSYSSAHARKVIVQDVLSEREKELSNLSNENRRAITSFMHKFSTDNFIAYTGKFFNEISFVEVEKKEYQKEFVEYELKVSSNLKSPTNFYVFLDGLNRYENIIQADFPINMEANESVIKASFTVKVYDINATK